MSNEWTPKRKAEAKVFKPLEWDQYLDDCATEYGFKRCVGDE